LQEVRTRISRAARILLFPRIGFISAGQLRKANLVPSKDSEKRALLDRIEILRIKKL